MGQFCIKSLKLTNFRCFEHLSVDFNTTVTVLVATNGGGKTSILDAIAVAYGPFVGAFEEAIGRHFAPDDIRLVRTRDTESNEMEVSLGGVRLEAEGHFSENSESQPEFWARGLAGPVKAKTTIRDAGRLIAHGKALQDKVRNPGEEVTLPLLAYYGTGRLWKQLNLVAREKAKTKTSRTMGYKDCLDPASSYKQFAQRFRYWSANSLKSLLEAAQANRSAQPGEFDYYIRSVAHPIDICLAPSGWRDLKYSFAREELVATHPERGELPVSYLSDGIRNMIGMVADIAFRATQLNPQFGADASSKTPGVVLIDEVDMHLHPEWQQQVLSSLTEAFPNIQFIVTTHSPQVLSTVASDCIRVIDRGVVRRAPPGTEGAEAARMLKRVLGVDSRPPHNPTAMKLAQYLKLVHNDQWASDLAISLRQELDAIYLGEEPALLEADLYIDNRKWEMEG